MLAILLLGLLGLLNLFVLGERSYSANSNIKITFYLVALEIVHLNIHGLSNYSDYLMASKFSLLFTIGINFFPSTCFIAGDYIISSLL